MIGQLVRCILGKSLPKSLNLNVKTNRFAQFSLSCHVAALYQVYFALPRPFSNGQYGLLFES